MRKFLLAATLILNLTLAACGGGGGGDSGAAVLAPAAALALTNANYNVAAQESVSSVSYILDSTSVATGAQVASDAALMQAVRQQVALLGQRLAKAPKVAVGVTQTTTEACQGGGSMTATANDLNGNENADPGDSISIVASNCVVAPGVTISGGFAASFTATTGNFGTVPYSATLSVTLQNFVAVTPAGRSTGNGRMDMAVSETGVNQGTVTVTVASLSTDSTFGNLTSTRTLTDFTARSVITPSGTGTSTSSTVSGTLTSTGLGSRSVTIATVAPLVQASIAQYPSSGQLIATGSAGSKVRLTVLNVSNVQLELDADGNGSYETSSTVAWSSLL